MSDRPDTTVDLDPLDRIDQSIDIDATARTVFDLVSRPGWWINDGAIDSLQEVRQESGMTIVTHPRHGEFRLETVESDPPSYVSIRWHHRLPDDGRKRSTLVEFFIAAHPEGGVTLRVVESGFAGLQKPREEWLEDRADNVEGWTTELAAARTFLEAV